MQSVALHNTRGWCPTYRYSKGSRRSVGRSRASARGRLARGGSMADEEARPFDDVFDALDYLGVAGIYQREINAGPLAIKEAFIAVANKLNALEDRLNG